MHCDTCIGRAGLFSSRQGLWDHEVPQAFLLNMLVGELSMEKELLRSHEAKKITVCGFYINAALTGFKLLAGFYGRSGAMVADGIHSLSDFLTDLVLLAGFKLTDKPEDECHNYGHDKYETLATIIVSLFLAVAGYGILRSAYAGLVVVIKGGTVPRPGLVALVAAAVSIVVKELLYRFTARVGENINSPAVIANAWHHRCDAFTSIGTFAGIGGSILLGDKWTVLDPLASAAVAVLVFKVALDIFLPAVNELLETSLSQHEREKIADTIKNCEGVRGYHDLRTRRIGSKVAIEAHVLVDKHVSLTEAHDTATVIENKLKSKFGSASIITLHVEPATEKALEKSGVRTR